MTASEENAQFLTQDLGFSARHVGPSSPAVQAMLATLGFASMEAFIDAVVPKTIRQTSTLALEAPLGEEQALEELRIIAQQNQPAKSLIGLGYYGTFTPAVIARNVFENPAWYTAYTPYQPEISQGRLEALLNFQTLVSDLTGMDLANASMLDEATAAAEAMTLCRRAAKSKANTFFVDENCFPQTIDVIRTRAKPLGIEIQVGNVDEDLKPEDVFGALFQYPGAHGAVNDFSEHCSALHAHRALAVMAADLLALVLLKSPGSMGADVAVGSSQRFGVPLGGGGPHAAYMATREGFKRSLPARLVGVSVDAAGKPAYRLALQTREQHIRREKATSNICTAQVLLAVMAGLYAVYHGPAGLRRIAGQVQMLTGRLASELTEKGYVLVNTSWFDTLTIRTGEQTSAVSAAAAEAGYNVRSVDEHTIAISLDETCSENDVEALGRCFERHGNEASPVTLPGIPRELQRSGDILTHPVFHRYHSETEMLRYLRRLADKDIALDRAMIPLGSCTMKLNATAEMLPVTWPEFANAHPFAPAAQLEGYAELVSQVESMLSAVTGYHSVSLQPNAGSQGEYAGLLAISAYHASRGDTHRDICLIPESAHGTNPASAQMCGMQVVVLRCDEDGNVDLDDLAARAEEFSDRLAAIMVTYPSTHGVFEEGIGTIADIVHRHGGQVYIDGANLNALVGLAQPGQFGGDVSHLNLHKTFCIPHGGGGPGVGPVAVREHLAPFLPGHRFDEGERKGDVVSAAPWGSASILPITWMYLRMMGPDGLRHATETAILSANYVAKRLEPYYPVLYTGAQGLVAHECIIDLRGIKEDTGVGAEDVAKRLIDYGFHAPTMSFPVAGTLMIEPTESESLEELDRFVEALIAIRAEIDDVTAERYPADDNPLVNAPHTAEMLLVDDWSHPYSRERAAYPVASLRDNKYWPPVRRVDNAHGDRNLVCSCPPLSDYLSDYQ